MVTRPSTALQPKQDDAVAVQDAIAEEAARDEHAFDFRPSQMKFPGGVFVIDNIEYTAKEVEGVILFSRKGRAMWPNGDQEEQRAPWCSSFGAEIGEREAQTYECLSCAYNQWGSGEEGSRGKACTEYRLLIVLMDGLDTPVRLRLPVTSIRNWDSYASGLAMTKSAYFAVRTHISLAKVQGEGAIEYYVAGFRSAGKLDMEEVSIVVGLRRRYADLVQTIHKEDLQGDGNTEEMRPVDDF